MHSSSESAAHVIPASSVDTVDVISLPVRQEGAHYQEPRSLRGDAVTHLADYRDGRAEGFDAGYAAGVQAGQADLASSISALRSATVQLHAAQNDNSHVMADTAIELAVELATAILRRDINTPLAFTTHAVDVARQEFGMSQPITLTMHPSDAELISDIADVTIVTDSTRSRGFAEATVGAASMRVDPTAAVMRARHHLDTVSDMGTAIHPADQNTPTDDATAAPEMPASTTDDRSGTDTDSAEHGPADNTISRRVPAGTTSPAETTVKKRPAATKTSAAKKTTAAKTTPSTKKAAARRASSTATSTTRAKGAATKKAAPARKAAQTRSTRGGAA